MHLYVNIVLILKYYGQNIVYESYNQYGIIMSSSESEAFSESEDEYSSNDEDKKYAIMSSEMHNYIAKLLLWKDFEYEVKFDKSRTQCGSAYYFPTYNYTDAKATITNTSQTYAQLYLDFKVCDYGYRCKTSLEKVISRDSIPSDCTKIVAYLDRLDFPDAHKYVSDGNVYDIDTMTISPCPSAVCKKIMAADSARLLLDKRNFTKIKNVTKHLDKYDIDITREPMHAMLSKNKNHRAEVKKLTKLLNSCIKIGYCQEKSQSNKNPDILCLKG